MTDVPISPAPKLAPAARRTVHRFVSALDDAMPGIFDDILLVGSAACRDFCERTSDVGFVGVAAGTLSPGQLDELGALHERIAAEEPIPPLDGIYVTRQDLSRGPIGARTGPHARAGLFIADGCHKRRPLDWHALATGSIALRGDGAEALDIWMDRAELDRDLLRLADELVAKTRDPASLDQDRASSAALEAARLHFTFLTGRVTSKTKAGLYGLIAFPERWRPVLDDALTVRGASPALSPTLSSDAGLFVRAVAEDMRALASP